MRAACHYANFAVPSLLISAAFLSQVSKILNIAAKAWFNFTKCLNINITYDKFCVFSYTSKMNAYKARGCGERHTP